MLPEIIARARSGDFAPLAAALAGFDDSTEEELNAALHYSVTCTEDVPRITPELRHAALDGALSARWWRASSTSATCGRAARCRPISRRR